MSAFTTAPEFETFLIKASDDHALVSGRSGAPQNARFIPRNFLNEERLDPSRIASYGAALPPKGPRDFYEWESAHNEYLKAHVFPAPPAVHDYRVVPRHNPSVCPETFRMPSTMPTFQETDFDSYLVRLVAVADIAELSREKAGKIFSLGEQVMANPHQDSPARQALSGIFEDAFVESQHRPVFAAFYEDFLEELRDPANRNWANRLRDRMGLYHISQLSPGGLPRPVFLFRYKVRDLPRHPREADRRPIAIPVVIDHRLFEAFCPAPRELDWGYTLNLEEAPDEEPVREVLHLFMPLQVEHLFRVGQVTAPAPEDLAAARRDHLLWLQLMSGRKDYALATDADLLK